MVALWTNVIVAEPAAWPRHRFIITLPPIAVNGCWLTP